ncbi:E3 ubiquitin-protein ligase AMFR-like isoform X2 [Mytilus trossulus]|uniref:E3 ubiquitin-protein ligase AMFR-like isoform X2 n=1 Tax=Mytilus trossulus TaxID=6551 RepID=UPI003004DF6F
MPVILLDRIPLPSLRAYTSLSVVLLSCAVFYAYQCVLAFQTNPHNSDLNGAGIEHNVNIGGSKEISDILNDPDVVKEPLPSEFDIQLPYESFWWNVVYVLTSEIWCIWTVVNTAYCCLILLAKLIQKAVFGELRVVEKQHLRDKFWNFLFYKFIFIFGVMNVQTMEEVFVWVAWFTFLGFFHLLTQLSKDRFEYLSFSPTTPRLMHMKLLSLLGFILFSCMVLLCACTYIGLHAGITIFAFMAAECLILAIRCLHVLGRYLIHLYEMNVDGVWENRSIYIYYTELIFELSAISIDFGHHLHMLLWGNIFLSMASLVICMQLRFLFYEFKRRLNRHQNYRRVVKNIEARFPKATEEEIKDHNDNCAVCWERMESSRKLPCGHLFHNACLLSWLEQDTSCPTCRMSLSEGPQGDPNGNVPDETGDARPNVPHPPHPPANPTTTNHFFHFDGSRYVSWLPSFSVEVTHTQLLPHGGARLPALQTSQLDNMARQVLSVFPHMPLNLVTEDLRNTRSVDFTIENILEGRLEAPPPGTLVTRAAMGDSESEEEPENQQTKGQINGHAVTEPETQPIKTESSPKQKKQTTPKPAKPTKQEPAKKKKVLKEAEEEKKNVKNVPVPDDTDGWTTLVKGGKKKGGRKTETVEEKLTADKIVEKQLLLPSVISQTGAMALAENLYQEQNDRQTYIDDNIPLLEENRQEIREPVAGPSTFGGRFSKSTNEREEMLSDRKNSMLEMARKKYLGKTSTNQGDLNCEEESGIKNILHTQTSTEEYLRRPDYTHTHTEDSLRDYTQTEDSLRDYAHTSTEDPLRRRELHYKAAQKRFNGETQL